jgi:hypothetical protein
MMSFGYLATVLVPALERTLVEIEAEKLSEPWVLLYDSDHSVTGVAEQSTDAVRARFIRPAARMIMVNIEVASVDVGTVTQGAGAALRFEQFIPLCLGQAVNPLDAAPSAAL